MSTHIALLRLSALGDIILWSALVEQCLRRYPHLRITWLCDPNVIPLFNMPPRLSWLPIRKPRSLGDYWVLKNELRLHHFDALLCGQASFRTNLIYPLCSATRKVGFDPRRGREGHAWVTHEHISYQDNHLIEGFAQFFEHIGCPLALNDLRWPMAATASTKPTCIPTTANIDIDTNHHPRLGLVLAASKIERTWPIEHQKAFLMQYAAQFPGEIALIGGPSTFEKTLAQDILSWSNEHPALKQRIQNLVGQTTLSELSATIQQLDVLVSPDSGPAHMAVAVGTPVVGLYAVARPELTGPYGSPYTINAYPEATRLCLGKDSNDLPWHTRVHDERAMRLITPEQVITQMHRVLGS